MRKSEKQIAEQVNLLCWQAITWGATEQLAGITDRNDFWARFRDERSARAELRRLITERVRRGEIGR